MVSSRWLRTGELKGMMLIRNSASGIHLAEGRLTSCNDLTVVGNDVYEVSRLGRLHGGCRCT